MSSTVRKILRLAMLAKLLMFCIVSTISSISYAGEWTRNSPSSITFTGQINKDELTKFLAMYRPTDQTIILNSGGGDIRAALNIAEVLIQNKNLTVVVHGMCASSCANYLFLAGHTRKIDHGVVGFHGSWGAYVASPKFKKESQQLAPDIRDSVVETHLRGAQEEKDFLDQTGVRQELFDKTQKENDEKQYDIYLPGPRAFEYYGIHGVQGSQDLSILNEWPQVKIQYDDGPTANSSTSTLQGIR